MALSYFPLYKQRLHINDLASSCLQVNEKATGTGIPVEQVFRFDDAELRVKAPPEVRNEISYSKQQKKK
jgi:hypothetical protein